MTFAQLARLAADTVEATQRRLPAALRELARPLPVHYESVPDADVVADGFPADILGLFTGDPHGSSLEQDTPSPPQILLYLDNLWDFSERDPAIFRDEVRLTYLHELGHFLGWDEDELTARGLD
ncbi:metallopeptidase family protein [Horticoccus luteus]|uniref:Metallopeptidase family protein n=1 Tax=Horticoccus luteus TaxID=2862869 RepID=A0A8F9TW47_9BACT|nr:metallopeptidase family protein [Horticoccus luteus]QYM78662.1 metallopeptidase family protein [Horticoccus luteus]